MEVWLALRRLPSQCRQDLSCVKSRIMFVINWLRVFSRTLPTAGLVGMTGHFYQRHLSPPPHSKQWRRGGQGVLDGGWCSTAGWHFGWLAKYLIELGRANPRGIGRGRLRHCMAAMGRKFAIDIPAGQWLISGRVDGQLNGIKRPKDHAFPGFK